MLTLIILHKPGSIMNLKTQRMAKPMRQERRGYPFTDHGFFRHSGNYFMFFQQLRDAVMHLNMVIGIADPGFNTTDQ